MMASVREPGCDYCPHTGKRVEMTVTVRARPGGGIDEEAWRSTPFNAEGAEVEVDWKCRKVVTGDRAGSVITELVVFVHADTDGDRMEDIRSWVEARDDVVY